ncbi:MAG: hypothetical protein ACPGUC_09365 [Gammaproteobacteria bacterium]
MTIVRPDQQATPQATERARQSDRGRNSDHPAGMYRGVVHDR